MAFDALIPVFIDRCFPGSEGKAQSLLALPVGCGSLLDHLAECLPSNCAAGMVVVRPFEPDSAGAAEVASGTSVAVLTPEAFEEWLRRQETSDHVLVIDPARWPLEEIDLEGILRSHGPYHGATHLIALDAEADRARERICRDGNGRLQSVQRLYNAVNWPEVANHALFLSIVPVWAMQSLRFSDLTELRTELARRGVLARDIPLPVSTANLTHPEQLLQLSELALVRMAGRRPAPGYDKRGNGIFVGRSCAIHPSARLVGPVALHPDVSIEEGATIIGPAVIGQGARLGRGAIVARALLGPHTALDDNRSIRHAVVWSTPGDGCTIVNGEDGNQFLAHRRPLGEPVGSTGRRRSLHCKLKRAMDFVLALVGLIILAPLLLVVAVLVKWTSPGRVLFTHRRERQDGTEFACMKFRTMIHNAHAQQRALYTQNQIDGPQFKLDSDPRVTRLGRWLRATNIDELPQLINVLKGDMSLVGPRPSPFRENQICVPWRRARLSVPPGITGLWQICRSRDRSKGDFHEWIFYDMTYVRHFSIWLDLKILLATVFSLAGRWQVPLTWLIPQRRLGHVPPAAHGKARA